MALRTPADRHEIHLYQVCDLFFKVANCWSNLHFRFSQHTVPARVRLWLLEPSRHAGKGNPLEDVHVSAEPKADVLPLHHATLGVHNPELENIKPRLVQKI